jgi:hypothetical protein
MDRIQISDDVAVRVLVFEEEGAKIRLSTLHHFLDGCYDFGIPNNDGLVESREQWTPSDRQSQDLRVDLWNRLFRNGSLGRGC